jgi:hypothetical protein
MLYARSTPPVGEGGDMPRHKLALEEGGDKRVELSWGMAWRNFTVRVDGQQLGTITGGHKAVREGRGFTLPDGSRLNIKLEGQLAPQLAVTRDGAPLPGSATHPAKIATGARNIVLFVAVFNMLIGLVLTGLTGGAREGIGMEAFVFGALFLVLGAIIHVRKSWVALLVATIIFGLDAVSTVVLTAMEGGNPHVVGIIVRVFLIIHMVRGVKAMYEQREWLRPDVGGARGAGGSVAVPVRTDDEG